MVTSSFVAMTYMVTSSFGRLPTETSNIAFVQLTCAFYFCKAKRENDRNSMIKVFCMETRDITFDLGFVSLSLSLLHVTFACSLWIWTFGGGVMIVVMHAT